MKIISNKKILIKIIQKEKKLGFIPTMGAIHKAHLSMVKKCNKSCTKSLVTIFINKHQFNKKSDYVRYPRVLKNDINLLEKNRVDYLYLPTTKQIYPKGPSKKIKISAFGKKLCGKTRPGHFEAVVDVIDRFIKIIKPNKIFLGEKDMQQLKIVEEFINRNKIKTKVIACKTIRETNGLAYSSRNLLLTPMEKRIASKIYNLLKGRKKKLVKNKKFLKQTKTEILKYGVNKIDYLEFHDINKLIFPYKKNIRYKIFVAYYLGSTRLIDNI